MKSNMFARAGAGASLSPAERAILKLLQGAVAAAVVTALPLLAQVLASQPANWRQALVVALPGIAVAVLMALSKYFTAQGDAPIGAVLQSVAQQVTPNAATSNAAAPEPVAPQA